MTRNLLSEETSPYLLQHKDNPVHWRPWGSAAMAEARQDNKPILLSVGYAACHWCHVMAHESFENEEIAALMNELFVNVKVDREERPDVDALYQAALAMMGQQGGWPLTMFLTPEGEPFWGSTYFPPEARYGRTGFPEVLRGIADAYHSAPEKIEKNRAALRDAISRLAHPPAGEGFSSETLDTVATSALRMVDPLHGGTTGAPKFPQPIFFRFLWRAYARSGAEGFGNAVTVTCTALCQGGIYDHVGGGFARYATDEIWLVPHFEKMLYDNALLIDLLTEVWRRDPRPLFARRVRETIDWAMRDLRIDGPDGTFGFASAYDADSEGVEGKYYVWTEAEIDDLLGTDAPLFKAAYDVSADGNWEGSTILNRRAETRSYEEAEEAVLSTCLETLREARSHRIPPLRDDKVLADCNGLMITALARAGVAFQKPEWLDTARAVFDFVQNSMQVDGRMLHAWCAGRARHPAVVDDYANMINAALALHQATGEPRFLDSAESWADVVHRHYWDEKGGGYFLSADDTDDLISRTKTIADHATPAGNGSMAEALVRLYTATGVSHYRERAETLIRLFSGDNPQYLLGIPGLLSAYEFLERVRQVVVVGDLQDPRTTALHDAALAAADPLTVVTRLEPGRRLAQTHPAFGKEPAGGTPTAWVCAGQTCGLPATDPDDLRTQLAAA